MVNAKSTPRNICGKAGDNLQKLSNLFYTVTTGIQVYIDKTPAALRQKLVILQIHSEKKYSLLQKKLSLISDYWSEFSINCVKMLKVNKKWRKHHNFKNH